MVPTTYRLTLPPDIPAARFWSITLYDNDTWSMLADTAAVPTRRSQSYPTPAATASADGSTILMIGPERPVGLPRGQRGANHGGPGLVPHPALLQPARAVLRQELAAERDRTGLTQERPNRQSVTTGAEPHRWSAVRPPCRGGVTELERALLSRPI